MGLLHHRRLRLGLRQTPTLSLFRDGDERTRLAGFQSPQQIEAAIALHL